MINPLTPLLSIQNIGTGAAQTHTVLIGYAEATLMGIGGTGSVGQEVQIDLEGNLPPRVKIYADTLYLQAGATYSWPETNVTIVARRLAVITPAAGPATISVSGREGAPAIPVTPPKKEPAPEPPRNHGEDGHPLTKGDGVKGADGHAGTNAGSLTVVAYEVDPACQLTLEARGGTGTAGLNGQDAQDGQPGAAGAPPEHGGGGYTFWSTPAGPGGVGGDGGRGGDAGSGSSGGNGGAITIRTATPIPATAKITLDAAGGGRGTNGSSGQGGAPGQGGLSGDGQWQRPSGNRGRDGLPSTATPIAGVGGPTGRPTVTPALFANDLCPDQIVMVMNRLRFAYLTKATLANLTKPNSDNSFAADLTQTINWLQIVTPAGSTSSPVWRVAYTLLAELAHKVANRQDFYKNQFDMVPVLNPDISGLSDRVAALADTETWYQQIAALVQDYETKKDLVKTQFAQLGQRMSADDAEFQKEKTYLESEARTDLDSARAVVLAAHGALDKQFDEKIKSIEKEVGFSLGGLLGSLGQVMMFANPEVGLASEAGKLYAGGAALSVASQFDTGTVDAGGQTVSKEYLVNQTKQIQAKSDALEGAFTSSAGGFLQPNGSNVMLLGQKSDFDSFFDNNMPKDHPIRAAMDTYMDAVLAQNQTVMRYNEGVSRFLAAAANKLEAQNATVALGSNLEQLDSPGLMQIFRLATRAYSNQIEDAIYQLYLAGRAYSCLALLPCNSLNALADLDSFGEVDHGAVSAALETLKTELETYRTGLATNQPEMVPSLTVSIDAAGPGAAIVNALRMSRRATIFLYPDQLSLFKVSQPVSAMTDIRVTSVKAYLTGIPLKTPVLVNVASGGQCQVQPSSAAQTSVSFSMPPVQRSNIFEALQGGEFKDDSTPDTGIIPNIQMTWGGGSEKRVGASLSSFFTSWTIAVPESAAGGPPIDLSNYLAPTLQCKPNKSVWRRVMRRLCASPIQFCGN
ncbi:MAG: hypothetical protein ABI560_07380 [Myxococcales bacterium]